MSEELKEFMDMLRSDGGVITIPAGSKKGLLDAIEGLQRYLRDTRPSLPADLKAIRERHSKATTGPWELITAKRPCDLPLRNEKTLGRHFGCVGVKSNGTPVSLVPNGSGYSCLTKKEAANADFIAHSWQDISYLLEQLNAKSEECERLNRNNKTYELQARDRRQQISSLTTQLADAQWISVEDRLPEEIQTAGFYLVMCDGEPEVCFYDLDGDWDCPNKGFLNSNKVTHWQKISTPKEKE
jgi:hypothetical protein